MRRALASLPVVLVLAAGCADSGKPAETTLKSDFGAQLRASVSKTAAQSSKMVLDISTTAGGQDVKVSGTGAFKGNVGSMKLSFGAISMEERITGGKLYLKVQGQPKWYVLTLSDLVGTSLADSANPSESTAILLSADNNVTKVGDDTVRGAKATHYKGAIPITKERLAKQSGLVKGATQKLLDSGVTSLPFDAWLDSEGRLVKMTETVDITVKGVKAHVVTSMERFAFGTPVNVVAPPLSEQQDGAQILAGLKQSGLSS